MRYLPHTEADRRAMLAAIGAPSIDALFSDVPEKARLARPVDLPPHKTELEVERATVGLSINQGLFGHGSSVIVKK